jgi:hypothetical protein
MTRLTRIVPLIAAGLVLMAADLAPAETIVFYDDFESDTAAVLATDDADPVIGVGDVGSAWAIQEPVDQARTQVQSGLLGGQTDNRLQMTRTTATGYSFAQIVGAAGPTNLTTGSEVRIEFDLFIASGITQELRLTTRAGVQSTPVFADDPGHSFGIRFLTGGNVGWLTTSNTGMDSGADFLYDEWNHVRIDLDLTDLDFRIYVTNSDGLSKGLGLNRGTATTIGTLQWTHQANGFFGSIDNLSVIAQIPTPAAVPGAALLATLAFARRRPVRSSPRP